MTNDTENTEPLEPYTAHELLSIRTITMTVAEGARLAAEHRAVLNAKAEAELAAERYQGLAETSTRNEQRHLARIRVLESDRDVLERRLGTERQVVDRLARQLNHHRERRAIGAGVKWQTLIERLREQGVTFDRTDEAVDAIMQRVLAGEHAMGAPADPTPVVDAVASPSFATQTAELIAKGVRPVDAAEQALEPAETLREAEHADNWHGSQQFAPVGSRVRLNDASGYGFREFPGCYGDVVALHPSYDNLRMVLWTGDTRPRPTNVRRLAEVTEPGAEVLAGEPTA